MTRKEHDARVIGKTIDGKWIGEWNGLGQEVVCPICGHGFMHIGNVSFRAGWDNYQAWAGRGNAVVIEMSCEVGCEIDAYVGFHKGLVCWRWERSDRQCDSELED